MVTCINLDSHHKKFCFEQFPNTPLSYQEAIPKLNSNLVPIQLKEKNTGRVFSKFIKRRELQRLGISFTAWIKLANMPQRLSSLISDAAAIDERLKLATPIAQNHLSPQFLRFFKENRAFANRIICWCMLHKVRQSPKGKNIPGIFFDKRASRMDIFVNLPETPLVGAGGFGEVRRVLWLTAPNQNKMLIVKKVFAENREKSLSHFRREIISLNKFVDKRGIISLIAGGRYGDKYVLFLPFYECDLSTYLKQRPFTLTMDEKLDIVAQWLQGLASISEKGIHGDLSPRNLLLKRDRNGKVEAVISDFGTFHRYDQDEYGGITLAIGSPEYYAKKMISSKQDVWAMGISMHEMFAMQWLPCWHFNAPQMVQWTSTLTPNWILTRPSEPETPQFLINLINGMLDPRPDHRPSAKEALEHFSKGLSSFQP